MGSLFASAGPAFHGATALEAGAGVSACLRERTLVGLYGEVIMSPVEALRSGDRMDKGKVLIGSIGAWIQVGLVPHRRLHPFLGAHAGFGRAALVQQVRPSDGAGRTRDDLAVFAPCIGAEWTPGWRARIAVRCGYRFVSGLSIPGVRASDLNGPFVGLCLLLDVFSDD